nr:tetratricopeptide repeat protein [Sphingomonas sp. SCN 67-18]
MSPIAILSTLIDVSLDPRLREAMPSGFDGRAEVERDLSVTRRIVSDHPESLSATLMIADYLMQLGRGEEALTELEAVRSGKRGSTALKDWDEKYIWWLDAKARTYLMLGRYDDGVAAFRRAMKFKEGDGRNVSQTINLGYAQLRFGRPADALATVSLLKPESAELSPYGRMEMRGLQGCARLALGQAASAKDDLDYAAAHEQDNPGVLTMLRLCAGDLDGAAAAIIHRLDDPELRPAALRYLSDYDPPPASYPVSPVDTRRSELKVRPDVQAAIARAGGVRRFRLQDPEI